MCQIPPFAYGEDIFDTWFRHGLGNFWWFPKCLERKKIHSSQGLSRLAPTTRGLRPKLYRKRISRHYFRIVDHQKGSFIQEDREG
jgi:hypothetical protein